MLKQILLSSTTLLFMSGCVTKEIIYKPLPEATVTPPAPVTESITIEGATFAGERLDATPEVSMVVQKVKQLTSNSAYLDLHLNNDIRLNDFLNIRATSNIDGYLKIIIIDPNGERKVVVPNTISDGYLKAHQPFSSNNSKFALQTQRPTGLHYAVTIFTEKRARMVMRQGMNGYDAIHNDQDFFKLLQSIKNQAYGKSNIRIFPIRIY